MDRTTLVEVLIKNIKEVKTKVATASIGKVILLRNFYVRPWQNPKTGKMIQFARGLDHKDNPISLFIDAVTITKAKFVYVYNVSPTKTNTLRCTGAVELGKDDYLDLKNTQKNANENTLIKVRTPSGLLMDTQFFTT